MKIKYIDFLCSVYILLIPIVILTAWYGFKSCMLILEYNRYDVCINTNYITNPLIFMVLAVIEITILEQIKNKISKENNKIDISP